MILKSSLDRLFRLRSLLEDVSRLELELRLQELAQAEASLNHLAESRRINRIKSFDGFTHAENATWLEAETLDELTAWQQGMLDGILEKRQNSVNAARADFLERRKELRQVENVIEQREAEKSIVRNRQEQRTLDDWFNRRKK